MKRFTTVLVSLAVLAVAGRALAEATMEEAAVAYRQGVYEVIGWNFGPLVGMVKQEIPFDTLVFQRNAKRMQAMVPMIEEGFIPNSVVGDSEAKPEIWDNWDDFKSKLQALQTEVDKLVAVSAGTDMQALGAQVGATGKACKACHDEYRKE